MLHLIWRKVFPRRFAVPVGESMTMATQLDVAKMKELIVCLVGRAEVGLTKLEKLMYLCDFTAAERLGHPITGETYRNFALGPVPKHFVPVFNELLEKNILTKEEKQLTREIKYVQLHTEEKCAEGAFSAAEMGIIEAVLREHGNKSAKQLVKVTHDELTYKMTKRNEEIPYFLAPYRHYRKMTETEATQLVRNAEYAAALRGRMPAVA